jgi:hypothetical protein
MTGFCPTDSAGLFGDFIQIGDDLLRSPQKNVPGAGQFYAPAVPFQQNHAHGIFQKTDLSTYRGLRYMQQGSCPGEAKLLGNRNKVA